MQIEKLTERIKDFMLWLYIAAFAAGIIYVACMGQTAGTPGEIIYEKTRGK